MSTAEAAAGESSEGERLARAGLTRIAEPGDPAVAEAIGRLGAVPTWERLRAGQGAGRVSQAALPGLALRAEGVDPRRDLEAAAACGARLVCPGDDEWPAAALYWQAGGLLDAPPYALWLRGPARLDAVVERAVAIVGARAATSYGVHVAADLAAGLADAAVAVVSGGAYGIDAAAHRGALSVAGAPTVAVLASGVDVAYPRGNDRLLAQIARDGLLVSELPPGRHPTRRHFLVRNRLIAALALGTVVVEAAARSGSLATVERARLLHRSVMAVPGPVTSALSVGCHAQLRAGAHCVTRPVEVLELVGRLGAEIAEAVPGRSSARDGLGDIALRVMDALPVRRCLGLAGLARQAGVSVLAVQQVLPPLQVHGLVEQTVDGYRLTALGAGR